jgi:hypothetical protein
LRHYRRRLLEGFSEQASVIVDMDKISVLATFRRLLSSPPMDANPAANFSLDRFVRADSGNLLRRSGLESGRLTHVT